MRFHFLFLFLLFLSSVVLAAPDAYPPLIYFDTYEGNKKAFIELAGSHYRPGWSLRSDATLTTDLAWYNFNSDQIVVITSGIHGIEGYVGSSVQRWIMNELKNKSQLKNDFLFVHALNPWGMKNKRRVNENNIDLNRNFSSDPQLYQQKNEDYLKIDSFLNPTTPADIGPLHRLSFIWNSIINIIKYSKSTLKQAILSGQYTQTQGLYYGGHQPSELQAHIDSLFNTQLKKYKKVIWVDLHTGYGERSKLHLWINESDSENVKTFSELFPQQKFTFGDEKNFYKTTGDLANYINLKSSSTQKVYAIVFEYGTMNSQSTLGSIESLRRTLIENQGYHHGYVNNDSEQLTKKLFKDMYFPQEADWMSATFSQTSDVLAPLLNL